MKSEKVEKILKEIHSTVSIVGVCKGRTVEEIQALIDFGIKILGWNYLQEAEKAFDELKGNNVEWHFIGKLQKNKVKRVVKIFSTIQSIDSIELAEEIGKRAKELNKIMKIFVEVNIGNEESKSGVRIEMAKDLIEKISKFSNIKIVGLMAMEPFSENPENSRKYFKKMKQLFEEIKNEKILNIEMKYLSMGMSNSFKVAIEEGSNMVRIGRSFFC